MSTQATSIFKFSTLNDIDKAYYIKLGGGFFGGLLAGILAGLIYNSSQDTALMQIIGWGIYFAQLFGLTFLTNKMYDLGKWTFVRSLRHAILMTFLVYLYMWITVFNFIIF